MEEGIEKEKRDYRISQWDWESPAPGIECGSSLESKGRRDSKKKQ